MFVEWFWFCIRVFSAQSTMQGAKPLVKSCQNNSPRTGTTEDYFMIRKQTKQSNISLQQRKPPVATQNYGKQTRSRHDKIEK